MYVEDVDLCWRLHRAGWAVLYEPSAHVVHEQGRSTSRHPYRMLAGPPPLDPAVRRSLDEGAERLLLPLVTRRPRRAPGAGVLEVLCRGGPQRPVRGPGRGLAGPGAGGVRGPEAGAG